MSFLKENKFAAITITLLVILNLALLSIFALPKFMHNSSAKKHNKGSGHYMANRIGFNETQLAEYRTLLENHRSNKNELQRNIDTKRKELYDLLKVEGNHAKQVDSLTNEIGMLSSQTEKATYQHFANIRALCTPEQLIKLDNMLKEAMRRRGLKDENSKNQHDRRSSYSKKN